MRNKQIIKALKDNVEIDVEVLECFELSNGKMYVIYKLNNDDDIYVSSVVETLDELVLDDVTDEEMEEITKMLKKADKEEV